jgi:hypothetical protein
LQLLYSFVSSATTQVCSLRAARDAEIDAHSQQPNCRDRVRTRIGFLRVFRLKGKFLAVSVSADASANLAVRLGRIKYLPRKAYLMHHVVWKILSK